MRREERRECAADGLRCSGAPRRERAVHWNDEGVGTWRPKVEVEKRGGPQVAPEIFCPQALARQDVVTAIFFLPVAKLS